MLLDTDDSTAAVIDVALLEQMARHKSLFCQSGWASYNTALLSILQPMPAEVRINGLRRLSWYGPDDVR